MKKISTVAIRIFSGFIGIMPFFLIYGISDFTAFILHYIIGYRRKVVQSNLKRCFPHKEKAELKKIEKAFYKNLSDIMIESVKGLYMTKKQLSNRFKVINKDVLQKYYDNGKSVISLSGHYGNWEWGILAVDFQVPHQAASIYKPMKNKDMEKFSYRKRSRFGMKLVSMKDSKTYFTSKKDKPVSFILAADQHPTDKSKAILVDFFNIKTPCLHGPEAYGRNTGMPLVYFNINRVKRGHYIMEIIDLFENPEQTEFGEITQKYMSTLEKIIRKKPEDWLWSHKRWKHKEHEIEEIKRFNQERINKEQQASG